MSGSVRPIRVVVFSGPFFVAGADMFLWRLERHPAIEVLRVYCHGSGRGLRARIADLWRRRGWLGLPIMFIGGFGNVARTLRDPRSRREIRRVIRRLRDRIEIVPDLHAPQVLSRVSDLKADLGLIYGAPILRPELFELPRLGTLGIHHGRLPEYRGKKTTFWEVYNGEEAAGVTVQRVNAGIDTGGIIKSGNVPIGRNGYGRVWRQVQRLGVEIYLEAILQLTSISVDAQPQPAGQGKLYHDPTARDLLLLWVRQLKRRLVRS